MYYLSLINCTEVNSSVSCYWELSKFCFSLSPSFQLDINCIELKCNWIFQTSFAYIVIGTYENCGAMTYNLSCYSTGDVSECASAIITISSEWCTHTQTHDVWRMKTSQNHFYGSTTVPHSQSPSTWTHQHQTTASKRKTTKLWSAMS